MTILAKVYASAPASEVLIPTIELDSAAFAAPIRVCVGFEDQTVTLEDASSATFTAAGLDVSLPKRDTTGVQSLAFAIDNVTGVAQRYVDDAIDAGDEITLTYRVYLASDLTAPAELPKRFLVTDVKFTGNGTVQVTATYKDIIGRSWPRKRYTAEFAPGLRYS